MTEVTGADEPRPRRIVFLSGTRADFGKIKSLIANLLRPPTEFEVHIFATGMHMDPRYGLTVREFEKCGFPNIYRFINGATHGPMDQALATTIAGFGQYVQLVQPDMIVVHGDRGEALAGAIVGSLNNILVAHVEGGEVSGTIDELIRHSVSKMSHLHFVSNQAARRRLVQLGEDPERVYVIGSPDVDIMHSSELPSLSAVREHYAIPFEQYGILAWHPVTTALSDLQRETQQVVDAALASGLSWVAIYPNSDTGSNVILAEYEHTLSHHPRVRLFPSVRFEAMLVLLRHAALVLGNSSMGIREAPYYGTPAVDVGTRQVGRGESPSVIHVSADRRELAKAIASACEAPRSHPVREWGQGDSHTRFRAAIERRSVWETPVQKRFRDIPVSQEQLRRQSELPPPRAGGDAA